MDWKFPTVCFGRARIFGGTERLFETLKGKPSG
jgi:hypothetical protein